MHPLIQAAWDYLNWMTFLKRYLSNFDVKVIFFESLAFLFRAVAFSLRQNYAPGVCLSKCSHQAMPSCFCICFLSMDVFRCLEPLRSQEPQHRLYLQWLPAVECLFCNKFKSAIITTETWMNGLPGIYMDHISSKFLWPGLSSFLCTSC